MKYIRRAGCVFFLCAAANIPFLYYYKIIPEKGGILFILLFVLGVIFLNIFPAFSNLRLPVRRLRVCADGCELLLYFLLSVTISAIGLVIMLPVLFPGNKWVWFADLACVMLVEASVFWCGIIRVYLTSSQLGVKWRTIGLLCGWIPVVHLVVLVKIIRMVMEEWEFESGKMMQAQERKDEKLCQTRYPILMVHGVFFRDFKYFN